MIVLEEMSGHLKNMTIDTNNRFTESLTQFNASLTHSLQEGNSQVTKVVKVSNVRVKTVLVAILAAIKGLA